MTLRRLLYPHTVDEFFSGIWEKQHLHVTREENPELQSYFEELITVDDIDGLLTTTYAAGPRRWDSIRMGQGGIMVSPDMYLSNRNGVMAEVDVERVLALHRSGASIILNSVHGALESVADLCRTLAGFMGLHVHANVYITPRAAQGFPRHFDPHDVFLLQVAGEKHWKLAHSPVPLATVEAQGEDQLAPQGPHTTVHLKSGELLYIPRGLLHEGITSTEMSAHLTIGVNPFTWGQLLHALVGEMEQADVEFRRSVPTGPALLGKDENYQDTLARLTRRLGEANELVGHTVERIVRERSEQNRPSLRGLLTHMHEVNRISLGTLVRLRGQSSPDIQRADDEIKLSFEGGILTLPAFTEAQVNALCAGRPIRGQDLPPGIDDAGKLVLVRRLVQEGLLVPLAERSASHRASLTHVR